MTAREDLRECHLLWTTLQPRRGPGGRISVEDAVLEHRMWMELLGAWERLDRETRATSR